MDEKEQRSLIHFLAKELKAYSHELMVYQLLAHMLKQAGVPGVAEILEKARQSPELQERMDKTFAGLDEILPPPDPGFDEMAKELLEKWKPVGGLPN
ncbi:MAG TPA: hypothetical protein VHZ09_20450 [Acidobacteriaceae bacterium]|jgi:hypothetical protein|nr:hypothetical protein [Acidobacteriaceae bacterium]